MHQCYWATQSRFIQRDGEDVELLSVDDAQWGPFDSYIDAQEWLLARVDGIGALLHERDCDCVACLS